MTPKEKYEERKKLRKQQKEYLLSKDTNKGVSERENLELIAELINSLGRIADVLELWADKVE
jgi:hypothetical protein